MLKVQMVRDCSFKYDSMIDFVGGRIDHLNIWAVFILPVTGMKTCVLDGCQCGYEASCDNGNCTCSAGWSLHTNGRDCKNGESLFSQFYEQMWRTLCVFSLVLSTDVEAMGTHVGVYFSRCKELFKSAVVNQLRFINGCPSLISNCSYASCYPYPDSSQQILSVTPVAASFIESHHLYCCYNMVSCT